MHLRQVRVNTNPGPQRSIRCLQETELAIEGTVGRGRQLMERGANHARVVITELLHKLAGVGNRQHTLAPFNSLS